MARRLWQQVFAVAGILLFPAAAFAGSASSSVAISSTVSNNCTISSATLAFGAYDPVSANASTDLTGTTTISFACTKGASWNITLGNGGNSAHATGTTRAMTDNGTNYLSYELYTDSGRTTVWNTTTFDSGTSTSKASQTVTVYGKVPAGQDVAAASYSDSVVSTINF